ncbi:major facilitator superfamily transporter [Sodiomyces alkalinus F11]|uniref:Major facilitator superfamily transporter n=1 Tax=Sodiomyces alkalinus (strain CBS 110278 / VKM F-3762 / F11) TaxID=1314773 RepID=A0A3N2Q9H8_SODAK|nr:major facilitator superfamily transporter [Sodiomyces alkalinus F11]ROT43295.1 major facilitator superfamily transporter [Sodiomyces alkalinus F11]
MEPRSTDMDMDIVDRELAAAAREASPTRYVSRDSREIERVLSAATSSSTTSSSSSSAQPYQRMGISRISTQPDLERHPTALSRIATQRSQHSNTVGRSLKSRESRKPLPAMGAGKPYPPPLPEQEEYVVEFDGPDDPMHAQNWPLRKKMMTAVILGFTTLTSAFASSIFSAATGPVSQEYSVSSEVGLLGVSLYVLGFAFGPTLWAPLSELKGRRPPLVIAMFGFSVFSIGAATGKDIQTILLCRFFAGFFGACPLAVVAAVFSDLFDNRTRGVAITIFSMAVFSGPLLSPFIGGFMVESHLGWRWTQYLVTIMGFVAFLLDLFFLEETYPPVILVAKAAELRRRTRNWGIHAKQEEIEVDFRELVSKNFSRPMRLLLFEPIVTLLSIYMAFIYGILYLFLTAYPIVFRGVHGFNAGESGLTFFGMVVGQLLAGTTVLLQQPWYLRKLKANHGVPVPEWRLHSVVVGAAFFAAGIFWFGWSGYTAEVHWIVPTLSGLFTGFGLMSIFLQSLNYLVDSYLMFAASAIAGNTFLRSLAGAGFPLFAQQMFNGMGIQWASTVLGGLAALMVPIPLIFLLYGHKIRAKSAYAPTFAAPAMGEDDSLEAGFDVSVPEPGPVSPERTTSGTIGANGGAAYLERQGPEYEKEADRASSEHSAARSSVPRTTGGSRGDDVV